MQKHILYLSYDGLTDSLGQSQILPYVKGLSKLGYRFTILSFEKRERFAKNRSLIQSLVDESGIQWVPLPFTVNPPLISKFYDAMQMRRKAAALHKENSFAMVHCRSYIAADVGLYMKQRFGTKFFFDMRGFWADEKKDGGHWDIKHPILRRVYNYYKKKEKEYLQNADYVISLTEAGKRELMTWPFYDKKVPLQVIPCCADMSLFSVTDATQKRESREHLGIDADRLVISYLGSVGMWYMLDEMLQFFQEVKKVYSTALFLFVTHSDPSIIEKKIDSLGLAQNDFIIMESKRKDVPGVMKASDINISFIKPVYSKISSSPTKLGEVLSMGIPVVCNSGVGDVERIVTGINAGYIIHDFSEATFTRAVQAIPELVQKSPSLIRNEARDIYSLDIGIEQYAKCYETLLQ
ncbi:MAG TPA: glycosyltransferase [Flavisolibacter sp.]|nr:glycosyltransferase [Flavisolibacter sp.]